MKNSKSKPLVVIQCYEDRQQTLPLRKSEQIPPDFVTNGRELKREATDNPPPPPPMPITNGHNSETEKIENQKSLTSMKYTTDLVKPSNIRNGSLLRTPTPDYNNKTDPKIELKQNIRKDEKVELESLESYKLKNPSTVQPKPPPNYFVRAPNGTATLKKHIRPVSVTIGEYASSGSNRREPSKLAFLNGEKQDGSEVTDGIPITNRLQSELALTLSRSNLRKKTESSVNTGR